MRFISFRCCTLIMLATAWPCCGYFCTFHCFETLNHFSCTFLNSLWFVNICVILRFSELNFFLHVWSHWGHTERNYCSSCCVTSMRHISWSLTIILISFKIGRGKSISVSSQAWYIKTDMHKHAQTTRQMQAYTVQRDWANFYLTFLVQNHCYRKKKKN